jgi:hypothetical protein
MKMRQAPSGERLPRDHAISRRGRLPRPRLRHPVQSAQYEFVPHVYRHVSHFVSGLVQLASHEPSHESAQLYAHVGQPGQLQMVWQLHSSPKTVPFAWWVAVVSKLSTESDSTCSVSLVRMGSSPMVWECQFHRAGQPSSVFARHRFIGPAAASGAGAASGYQSPHFQQFVKRIVAQAPSHE